MRNQKLRNRGNAKMPNYPKPSSQGLMATQTTGAYGPQMPEGSVNITWEDMLQDEKIEKIMHVVTSLYRRTQVLERDVRQLRRHKHNEFGSAIIEQEIGGPHDIEETIRDNPFNSKELAESPERMY